MRVDVVLHKVLVMSMGNTDMLSKVCVCMCVRACVRACFLTVLVMSMGNTDMLSRGTNWPS